MSWQSLSFLGVSAFFLLTAALFSGLALGRHPGTQHWRWRTLLIVGLAAAIVLTCASFYRNLTVFGQGALLGSGIVILLEQLRRLGLGYLRRKNERRSASQVPSITAMVPQAVEANNDSVQYIRSLCRTYCKPPFEFACTFLSERAPESGSLSAYLLREHVFPHHHLTKNKESLDEKLSNRKPFEDEFAEILDLFRKTLVFDYTATMVTLRLVGEQLYGSKLYLSNEYRTLRNLHMKATERLKEAHERNDLWFSSSLKMPMHAVDSTVLEMLVHCLPESSAPLRSDPPHSRASAQSPPPLPESSG